MEISNEAEKMEMPFGELNVFRKDKSLCTGVIAEGRYCKKFARRKYNVHVGYDIERVDDSYRATQMMKGIYLGHNVGSPCKIKIQKNDMYLYMDEVKDYEKAFWSFAIKYILTIMGLQENVLHIKGLLLRSQKGKLILLLGKGQSGKTTLGMLLEQYGYKIISNTHCFVKNGYVWGINSWIRIRNNSGQTYARAEKNDMVMDGMLDKCYVVDWNGRGKLEICDNLKNEEKYFYIKNFVAATNNYDLKEEVWDYMSPANNVKEKLRYFKREDSLVRDFVRRGIDFVTIDAKNENCLLEFVSMLEE